MNYKDHLKVVADNVGGQITQVNALESSWSKGSITHVLWEVKEECCAPYQIETYVKDNQIYFEVR